jgi:hypothetical protein
MTKGALTHRPTDLASARIWNACLSFGRERDFSDERRDVGGTPAT